MAELPEELRLEGDGFVLRDWREADAPALEPVCGEWLVSSFSSVPWEYSEPAALAWIERQRRKRADGEALSPAILEPGRELPSGHVNLTAFSPDGREAAIGYWVLPEARGRGLAVAAARVLLDWGLDVFDLRRIEFAILPDNLASLGVATRLGAEDEGLRERHLYEHDHWWDMRIYSVSR